MSPQDRVQTAFRDHAVALPAVSKTASIDVAADDATEPPSGVSDWLRISESVNNGEIVGLGEATHGTRECFQHKARLIRSLVVDSGFRTVAFEVDAATATALDAFVRQKSTFADAPSDAESALTELDMWQWQTETVRDLLRWLRTFNAGRTPAEHVRVRGVDLSTPSAVASPLGRYFEHVESGSRENGALQTIASASVPEDDDERERVLDAVAAAAEALVDRLERNRGSEQTTTSEWAEARHFCRVIHQAAEWARVRHEQPGPHSAGMAARDRFMAENALWALEQDTGAGVVLWAHDGHVQRGTFDDGTPWRETTTMGDRLADELGHRYRPVGFDFARGSFRAVGAGSGDIETFSVGDPAEGTATAAFASVGNEPYALDLRAAATDPRLDSWFGEEHCTRYVGSVFDPEGGDDAASARTDLPESFDYLLFVPESTPTRPVEGR